MDGVYIEEFGRRVEEARTAFTTASRHATSDREAGLAVQARSRFEQWVRLARREFDAFSSGRRPVAVADSVGPDRAIRKSYEASLASAGRLARETIRTEERSYAGASRRAVMILLACLLGVLALGLAVTVWVVRKILKPVYVVLKLFAELKAPAAGVAHSEQRISPT